MPLDRRDPEYWETLRFRKEQRDDEFRRGEITESVYLACLKTLGYLPREARTELNLLLMECLEAKNHEIARLERSREWIEEYLKR